MASTASDDGLQIDRDLDFERLDCAFQRLGWGIMLAAAAAALLGVLGPGPLTRWTAQEPGGRLAVSYYRFERAQALTELEVKLGPEAVRGGQVRVWLSEPYVAAIDLRAVVPPPQRVELAAQRLTFVFWASDSAQGASVRFRFAPRRAGGLSARVGLDGGAQVQFRQFVYP